MKTYEKRCKSLSYNQTLLNQEKNIVIEELASEEKHRHERKISNVNITMRGMMFQNKSTLMKESKNDLNFEL